ALLEAVRGQTPERQLRLFAVSCCRRVGRFISDDRSRNVLEVAERFAEGRVSAQELATARVGVLFGAAWLAAEPDAWQAATESAQAAARAVAREAARAAATAAAQRKVLEEERWRARDTAWFEALHAEQAEQCRLLRCLFGPGGNAAVQPDPDWLAWGDRTVSRLAQAILDEGEFSHLPILADALEEAGCSDQEILGHLRGPGPHARGCWAIDLLLARE
ncbi:MAG TPA: hypothetical protein VEL76_09940, partial [Gemmataceae bacterium]|nr:hypothetical protein [Gemmataceae bacterium]